MRMYIYINISLRALAEGGWPPPPFARATSACDDEDEPDDAPPHRPIRRLRVAVDPDAGPNGRPLASMSRRRRDRRVTPRWRLSPR